MANPVIRESGQMTPVVAHSASFSTSANVKAQDFLVVFHALDYNAATELLTPTGGSGTWALQATGDAGSTNPSIKGWLLPVTADGVQTVTVTQQRLAGDPQLSTQYAHWTVINGAGVTLSVDGTPSNVNGTTASTAQTFAAITTVGADDLWMGCIMSGTFTDGNYTTPSGATLVAEEDNPGAATIASYRQLLTSSGSTGTKTATFSTSQPWCSVALAIQSVASAATPAPRPPVVSTAAVQRAASW